MRVSRRCQSEPFADTILDYNSKNHQATYNFNEGPNFFDIFLKKEPRNENNIDHLRPSLQEILEENKNRNSESPEAIINTVRPLAPSNIHSRDSNESICNSLPCRDTSGLPWISTNLFLLIEIRVVKLIQKIVGSKIAKLLISFEMGVCSLALLIISIFLLIENKNIILFCKIILICELILSTLNFVLHIIISFIIIKSNHVAKVFLILFLALFLSSELITTCSVIICINYQFTTFFVLYISILFIYSSPMTIDGLLNLVPSLIYLATFTLEFIIRLLICKLSNPCVGIENEENDYLPDPVNLILTKFHETAIPILCVICLEELLHDQEVCQLNCHHSHVFHYKCMEEWVKNSNLCPNCRSIIECKND